MNAVQPCVTPPEVCCSVARAGRSSLRSRLHPQDQHCLSARGSGGCVSISISFAVPRRTLKLLQTLIVACSRSAGVLSLCLVGDADAPAIKRASCDHQS